MQKFTSGKFLSQGYYKSFQPSFINKQWRLENMEVIELLSQADRELGRLDMFSEYVPNIDLFISMHVLKEATQSSKIEGTQTRMDEALLDLEDIPSEKRDDWEEVQNYILALNEAIKNLEKIPLSSRLIKNTHKILLQGVRGEHKQPGSFRNSQNWIGGATLKDATFIPPVHTSVSELMSDLEKFIHNQEIFIPPLARIGIIHYQFETIHPFLDGNGRIGRLMIPLFLVSKGILKRPILYLSDYFETHRNIYYNKLMAVRLNNDINQWIKFFLVGIIDSAKNGIITFNNILQLQKQVDLKLQHLGSRAAKAQKVTHYLYQKPVINAESVGKLLGISAPSSYKLIEDLEKLQILKEITGGQRKRLYLFKEYFDIFNDKAE